MDFHNIEIPHPLGYRTTIRNNAQDLQRVMNQLHGIYTTQEGRLQRLKSDHVIVDNQIARLKIQTPQEEKEVLRFTKLEKEYSAENAKLKIIYEARIASCNTAKETTKKLETEFKTASSHLLAMQMQKAELSKEILLLQKAKSGISLQQLEKTIAADEIQIKSEEKKCQGQRSIIQELEDELKLLEEANTTLLAQSETLDEEFQQEAEQVKADCKKEQQDQLMQMLNLIKDIDLSELASLAASSRASSRAPSGYNSEADED